MAIDAGNSACTTGLSKAIYDVLVADSNAGFSSPMSAGQTTILKALCWDFAQGIATTVNAGSVLVRDEGVDQGTVQTFDFVGAGISVSVAGGVATVTVTGGGGGGPTGPAGGDLGGTYPNPTVTSGANHGHSSGQISGLGTAATHAATDFDAAGDASAAYVAAVATASADATTKANAAQAAAIAASDPSGSAASALASAIAHTVSTTAPLTGGGAISGNPTLAISAATTLAAGSMSAADKSKLDGIAAGAAALSSAPPSPLGTAAAGSGTTATRSDHVHAMPSLDLLVIPAADYAMNSHKLTGLAAGSAAGDSARWEQTPAGIFTTRGDNVVAGASAVPQRLALGAAGKFRRSDGTDDKWSTATIPDTFAAKTVPLAATADTLTAATADTFRSTMGWLGPSVQRFGSGTGEDATWAAWTLTSVAGSTVSINASKLKFVTTTSVAGTRAIAQLTLTADQYLSGVRVRWRLATWTPSATSPTAQFLYGYADPLAAGVVGDGKFVATNISGTSSSGALASAAGTQWFEISTIGGTTSYSYGTGTTTTPPTAWTCFRSGTLLLANQTGNGRAIDQNVYFFVQHQSTGTATYEIDNCTVATYGIGP